MSAPIPRRTVVQTADGRPCIVTRAQVQGEPFGYIHHYAAHDERVALIDTTWEADGCADPLPHPTFPAMWKWSHCTPFYTTPQPAQATQAEVTDEQIAACVKRASTYGLPFVGLLNPGGTPSDFSKRFTAEILALRPVQVPMTDEQVDSLRVDGRLHWLGKRQLIRAVEAHHGIKPKEQA